MFKIIGMNELNKWINENGTQGRQALFEKIKKQRPGFTQTGLSYYINGKRIPDREMAEIIAKFIGVPLEAIPHRYTHIPELGAEADHG
jgi:hypothetical protein